MNVDRYAFIKAGWHGDIVDSALKGFYEIISMEQVEVFDVPGAFELPLMTQKLASTGRYTAVICAALVVDGGIFRHDFVAQAVVDGLVRVSLDTQVPILSASLTPHHFQETDHHQAIFQAHLVEKGREAASATLQIAAVQNISVCKPAQRLQSA